MNRITIFILSVIGACLLIVVGFFVTRTTSPYTIRISATPAPLSVGTKAMIRTTITENGEPFDVEAHGRLLHVMVVSANMEDSYHTYQPTQESPGTYAIEHIFTQPGNYRVWVELDDTSAPVRHDEYAEYVTYKGFMVAGNAPLGETLSGGHEKTVGPYHVHLVADPLRAGEETAVRFVVHNAQDEMVHLYDHEPFLYFISGENFSFFRHGHGATLSDGSPGLVHTFPHAGNYVMWAQLQFEDGGSSRAVQVPFLITVGR